MNNTIRQVRWFMVPMIVFMLVISGCKKSNSSEPENTDNSDIPANPTTAIPATTVNNIIPSATFTKMPGNENRIQINLLGIINPTTGQTIVFDSNNLFVVEDGTLKGIKITQVGSGVTLKADVVFIVDNSGSMSEEADSIASKIIAFSNYLQTSGMDVRVGCVGHGYDSDQKVYGALNLTNASSLSAYLNRKKGTSRTVGFSGSDSTQFKSAAATFGPNTSAGGENSIVGIMFADTYFSWRSGANRVYVIVTDEPTQPGNVTTWSTEGFRTRWSASKGTIHSVYSVEYWNGSIPDTTKNNWSAGTFERPWTLATLTGGTIKFIHSDATDLDLTQLPVTGALSKSYLIEFLSSNPNISHDVSIIVKLPGADGKATYSNITY